MYTVYGSKGSGSAAIEVALTLANAPFQLVEAASWIQGPGREELQAINPLTLVPTIKMPDGQVLSESAAILIELGLRHPASHLLPTDAAQRAQVIRGLVYVAANCYAAIGIADFPERWYTEADPEISKRIKAGTRARLHYLWEVFADLFPLAPYLNGEHLGALDILATVVSRWSGAHEHLTKARPDLAQHFEHVIAHPSVNQVLLRHWPAKTLTTNPDDSSGD